MFSSLVHLIPSLSISKFIPVFNRTSEGNPWLRHSSHPWHLARPPQRLPWPLFSKNRKQGALRVWNLNRWFFKDSKGPPNTERDLCSAVGFSSIFSKSRTASRDALKKKEPPVLSHWKTSKSKNRQFRFLFQTSFEKQKQTPDGYQVSSQDS